MACRGRCHCRNKVDAPDCILGACTLQKGAEAVHAINLLEGGGGGESRRGAEIFLVPIVRKRVEGTINMVLGSTDTLHAGRQLHVFWRLHETALPCA